MLVVFLLFLVLLILCLVKLSWWCQEKRPSSCSRQTRKVMPSSCSIMEIGLPSQPLGRGMFQWNWNSGVGDVMRRTCDHFLISSLFRNVRTCVGHRSCGVLHRAAFLLWCYVETLELVTACWKLWISRRILHSSRTWFGQMFLMMFWKHSRHPRWFPKIMFKQF